MSTGENNLSPSYRFSVFERERDSHLPTFARFRSKKSTSADHCRRMTRPKEALAVINNENISQTQRYVTWTLEEKLLLYFLRTKQLQYNLIKFNKIIKFNKVKKMNNLNARCNVRMNKIIENYFKSSSLDDKNK